jgi:hypothetical protein
MKDLLDEEWGRYNNYKAEDYRGKSMTFKVVVILIR